MSVQKCSLAPLVVRQKSPGVDPQMSGVSHAKSKRKTKGYNASRRTARLNARAQRLLDKALQEAVARKVEDPDSGRGRSPRDSGG